MTVSSASVSAAAPAPVRDPAVWTGVAAVGLGVLTVLLLALFVGGGLPATAAPGTRSADALTGWGLPLATLMTRFCAVGAVGSLVFAALLARSSADRLAEPARGVVRAAAWWASGWAASVAASALCSLPRTCLPSRFRS